MEWVELIQYDTCRCSDDSCYVRGIVRAVSAVPRSDGKGKTAVPRSDEKGKAVAVVAEVFRSVLVGSVRCLLLFSSPVRRHHQA